MTKCIDNIKSVTSAVGPRAQSILFMLIYGNDHSSTLTLHFLRPSYDNQLPTVKSPSLITVPECPASHSQIRNRFAQVPYYAHSGPVVSSLFLPESLQFR